MRLETVALVWSLTALAVGGLWFAARDLSDRPQPTGAANRTPMPARQAPGPGLSGDGWTVVRQTSAHYMLVLEVESERVAEADRIARQLTEPVKDRYTEVMVYVYRPGRRGGLPAARVQWTHRSGYDVTEYSRD